MEFVFVEDIKEVFRHALAAPLGQKPKSKRPLKGRNGLNK